MRGLDPNSWLARDMALHGDRGQVDPAYEAMCSELDAPSADGCVCDQSIPDGSPNCPAHGRTYRRGSFGSVEANR